MLERYLYVIPYITRNYVSCFVDRYHFFMSRKANADVLPIKTVLALPRRKRGFLLLTRVRISYHTPVFNSRKGLMYTGMGRISVFASGITKKRENTNFNFLWVKFSPFGEGLFSRLYINSPGRPAGLSKIVSRPGSAPD
jgi:hypothetical protein